MPQDETERDRAGGDQAVQHRGSGRRTPRPRLALSYTARIVEERILAAQKAGAFDSLPGRGKPLDLEDLSQVPQDLRLGYLMLKNAHMLPPELEVKKQILSLQDLLAATGAKPKQGAIFKEIQEKLIYLDILHRRSFGQRSVGYYGKKLIGKLRRF